MKVELKEKSLLTWLYKQGWRTNELPKSLCPYFWKLLIVLLCLPMTWPIVLMECKKKYFDGNGVYLFMYSLGGLIIQLMVFATCVSIYTNPITVLSTFLIIFGGGYGVYKCVNYCEKVKERKLDLLIAGHKPKESSEFYKTFSSAFKAIQDKVCPIIEWKKDDK